MAYIDNYFFRLLRFTLGGEDKCPLMSLKEWKNAYQMAKKQTLSAFIGSSLVSVKSNVLLETDKQSKDVFESLILEWMGDVIKTTRRNKKVNADIIEAVLKLEQLGVECCLLKGQGNAIMYPNPKTRTSGDIDMWVRYKGCVNNDGNIRKIIQQVKASNPKSKATYHHIDASDINGTPVEIHYRPQFLFSYNYNKRLQNFFIDNSDEQFAHKVIIDGKVIAIPTEKFNIVFQLSHIYNHLFHEGIGLRQVIDYYYVLKSYAKSVSHDNTDWNKLLKDLGLLNIAGAIMWILSNALGMDSKCLIVPTNETRGRFVLNEILKGGNFGKYDERSSRFGESKVGKNIQRVIRDVRLIRFFPSEALSEPFFRLWHAWWRLKHN